MKMIFRIDVDEFFRIGEKISGNMLEVNVYPEELTVQEAEVLILLKNELARGGNYRWDLTAHGLDPHARWGCTIYNNSRATGLLLKTPSVSGVKLAIAEALERFVIARRAYIQEIRAEVKKNNAKLQDYISNPKMEKNTLGIYATGDIGRYGDAAEIEFDAYYTNLPFIQADRKRYVSKRLFDQALEIQNQREELNSEFREQAEKTLQNDERYLRAKKEKEENEKRVKGEYQALYNLLPDERKDQYEAGFLEGDVLHQEMREQIVNFLKFPLKFWPDSAEVAITDSPTPKHYRDFIEFCDEYPELKFRPAVCENTGGAYFYFSVGGLSKAGFVPLRVLPEEEAGID